MKHNAASMLKFRLISRCGNHARYLLASDLVELLGVSRATAYRMIAEQRLTPLQREMLELKIFGLIPGWDGWQIEPGALVDPQGYRYTVGEIMGIPYLKALKSG
ncbi:hypothetical protein [Marinobacterium litorale]|uniref:hypothetical protein n=1 Tax=Marinobacterium litorale TaxID=404770 RepID=UPI00040DAE17|nr:hypothetical protein [Marinobacterium litorale]